MDGVRVEEADAWREGAETWRVLRILSYIDRDAQPNDLLAFLLVDVFANHLVGDRARADGQVSAGKSSGRFSSPHRVLK